MVSLAVFQDFGKVICDSVFNARVGGAGDFAGGEDIPHGKVMAKQKVPSLGDGSRDVGSGGGFSRGDGW